MTTRARSLIMFMGTVVLLGACCGCQERAADAASTNRLSVSPAMTDPSPINSANFDSKSYLGYDPP